ncbi:hypothetical protein Daesc_001266 [Daldinia eschscholtzii]|uniref:Uncharacterized protein n=1 Tax=Daldinia eschscholtzii TaxID=292717 RepID=A0AAX6N0S5_9PEZI
MDFAPYQSSPPENNRPFSPPRSSAASPRASLDNRRPFSPSQHQRGFTSPPPLQHPQPQRSWQATIPGAGGSGYAPETGAYVSEFDTSLGIRLDYEACLAYLALPPLGAIILLIVERKSDFVSKEDSADVDQGRVKPADNDAENVSEEIIHAAA